MRRPRDLEKGRFKNEGESFLKGHRGAVGVAKDLGFVAATDDVEYVHVSNKTQVKPMIGVFLIALVHLLLSCRS